MCYRGDVYDQSVAALFFIALAELDLDNGRNEDACSRLSLAKELLDALIFLEENDPIGDGRIRAAYHADDLLWIMDPNVGVGNMAWFGIALTRFYSVGKRSDCFVTIQQYLEVAEEKAQWILDHCKDERCEGGFTGGYKDWGQTPITWKSTEHNIDVYVFARALFELTGKVKWQEMAKHAQDFVKSMYVEVDPQRGYYWTGTLDDGCTPNESPIPTDAQTWATLARIDSKARAEKVMQWVWDNLLVNCCPEICTGAKFSDVGTNVQTEATAGGAMAFLRIGRAADATPLFTCLDWIRRNAAPPNDGIEDGLGLVATPAPEGAWTGYGDAWYYKLLHVASSGWTGLACLYKQGHKFANPLASLALHVDDDASNDPCPGDPTCSDPDEDGSPEHPFDTIQEAIDAAWDCDIVIVLDGTYTGGGNRDLNFGGKAITVRSENGPTNCIINAEGTDLNPHRGFIFQSGEGPDSIVEGFTIKNGYAADGGGIACESSSSPTVSHNIISHNTATEGGGIACLNNSSPGITNNTIAGNPGGGVYCNSSSPTIKNCIVWGNGDDLHDCTATYSCIEDGDAGDGNIDEDPLFANNGDYHLKSEYGRWHSGLGLFVLDEVTSLCIDGGDSQEPEDRSNETLPNGCAINIGAYGNTVEASRRRVDSDVTGDGKVNILDMIYVRNHLNSPCR